MNKTEQRMANNMSAMLQARGYEVEFTFTPKACIATIPTMVRGATAKLEFTQLMSPGEIVWEIQRVLDKLNSLESKDND